MAPALHIPTSIANVAHINGNGVKKHIDGFGTRAVHVGSDPNEETGAVIPPISLSTTYKQSAIGVHKVMVFPFSTSLMWLTKSGF